MAKPQRNVPFSSPEGIHRFQSLSWKPAHTRLFEAFQPQETPVYCALASLCVAANSLLGPEAKLYQHSVLNRATEQVKPKRRIAAVGKPYAGLALGELQRIARLRVPRLTTWRLEPGEEAFRRLMQRYQKSANFRVIMNFVTAEIWGGRGGHFSPVGGYHAATDSVLVLDVAIHRTSWYWCPVERLVRAMSAVDPQTGSARGCLVIGL